MTDKSNIPAIPADASPAMKIFLRALMGRVRRLWASDREKLVSMQDLIDLGLVDDAAVEKHNQRRG